MLFVAAPFEHRELNHAPFTMTVAALAACAAYRAAKLAAVRLPLSDALWTPSDAHDKRRRQRTAERPLEARQ
jgi:uncharacterized OsmC-like protein